MVRNILLIEDNYSQAIRLQRELQCRGFLVEVARHGNQGLAPAIRNQSDAIILDVVCLKYGRI